MGQQTSEQIFFGKGGMLRSGFGKQTMSATHSSPAFGFGSGSRDAILKTYMSSEHDKAQVKSSGGKNSQGAVYNIPSGFGKQVTSTMSSSSTQKIGSEKRRSMATQNGYPGPGSYKSNGAVGNQTLSFKQTAGKTVFGTASRDCHEKQFITKDHKVTMYGKNSPGPSAYKTMSGIGKQVASTKQNLPQWKIGSEPRFDYDHVRRAKDLPGAGQYEASSTIGKQIASHNQSLPKYSFGSSTRDQSEKMFLSKDHEKGTYGRLTPGPATASPWSGIGKQVGSTKKTCNSTKFGTDSRFKGHIEDVPGPGSYAA